MEATITRRPSVKTSHKAPPPVLRLVYTPSLGVVRDRIYTLLIGDNQLGRDAVEPDGLIIPEDGLLSRTHAYVRLQKLGTAEYGLYVRDVGSKNGTTVNGVPLQQQEVKLQLGDVLRVGDSFLTVSRLATGDEAIPALIGDSADVAELRARLHAISPTTEPVLLLGENGTGKEVAAREIHRLSKRSGEFVAVNASAIPAELLESQFFGQVGGAFTGARPSVGFFRFAHRGTLFIDEVGDLPLSLQPKLLRALEQNEVTPVGATASQPCEVRIIAATNCDLLAAIANRQFREDLYARLEGALVHLSPLRNRREDILPIIQHCVSGVQDKLNAEVVNALLTYRYPRNIRQLLRLAKHLSMYGSDKEFWDRLTTENHQSAEVEKETNEKEMWVRPSRDELDSLLRKHAGVLKYVAREIGCSPRTLGRFIELERLDLTTYRSTNE